MSAMILAEELSFGSSCVTPFCGMKCFVSVEDRRDVFPTSNPLIYECKKRGKMETWNKKFFIMGKWSAGEERKTGKMKRVSRFWRAWILDRNYVSKQCKSTTFCIMLVDGSAPKSLFSRARLCGYEGFLWIGSSQLSVWMGKDVARGEQGCLISCGSWPAIVQDDLSMYGMFLFSGYGYFSLCILWSSKGEKESADQFWSTLLMPFYRILKGNTAIRLSWIRGVYLISCSKFSKSGLSKK